MPATRNKPPTQKKPTHTPQSVLRTVTNTITLTPQDWFWAPWRKLQPLPRPVPVPFDAEECAERRSHAKVGRQPGRWNWTRAEIAQALTPEEASFWFEAMLPEGPSLHNQPPGGPAQIVTRLANNLSVLRPEILLPLSHFLTPATCVELLVREDFVPAAMRDAPQSRFVRSVLRDGLRQYLFPYLAAQEADRVRDVLRSHLDPNLWPTDSRPVPAVFSLAAALGMHTELLPLVESWPVNPQSRRTFVFQNNERQNVIFGLASPEQVLHHLRRLRLRPLQPEHARAWLAHFGVQELDWMRDTIERLPRPEQAERLVEVLCLVQAPEAAAHMLDLKLHSPVPRLARRWLNEQVGNAVAGLVPVAAGRGKKAEAAREFLAEVRRCGEGELIKQQLTALPISAARKLKRALFATPLVQVKPLRPGQELSWLEVALAETVVPKKNQRPDWLGTVPLPPVVVPFGTGYRSLNEDQLQAVFAALRASTLDAPTALVRALRQHAEPACLDAFACTLFQTWLDDGMPASGNWVMATLGLLGGDGAVARLIPRLSAWRENGRVAGALDTLAAIGSATAFLQIQCVARDASFKQQQTHAEMLLTRAAAESRLTRDQFEDAIFPTSADKNQEKQQLRQAQKIQTQRLEEAMLNRRRWPVAAFEHLVGHPLLGPLARRLVWGGFVTPGRLECTFGVAEDGCCVDLGGEGPLETVESVGIVHPLELSEAELRSWQAVFASAGLEQPFQQLARPVERLPADWEAKTNITWLGNLGIPSSFFWRQLRNTGWKRPGHELALPGWGYVKQVAGVTAVMELEGAGATGGSAARSELMCIRRCYFLRERSVGSGWGMPLGDVDQVVMSEVLCDLTGLAIKGQELPPRNTPEVPEYGEAWEPELEPNSHEARVLVAFGSEDDIPF